MNENQISQIIVNSAIEVHRTLGGPGLREIIYEQAFEWELRNKGLEIKRQQKIPVFYNRVMKNKRDVIASDQRERSNLVFASERPDCFVASLLAMTKFDFFSSLISGFYLKCPCDLI